ncbi:hypothetical protein LCGC14_0655050 [marine sediment metagenome]|uniref:Uncharacterized protein n=1 Tax=marine sediment metagenome TaxID=412755 RepID=A0A0F9U3K2_9ZZZZ
MNLKEWEALSREEQQRRLEEKPMTLPICRIHGNEKPFTDEEKSEFHQMLKDHPEIKKAYEHFKLTSCQHLRSRLGQDPLLDKKLDKLFEIAAISEEGRK